MDYQFACMLQFLVLSGAFYYGDAIVGRDLVLTPKHGLQKNGKSIYYAEESIDNLRNRSSIPWERALKHVTFVTIFSNSAAEAVAGNLSKLREYKNFLQSPYIRLNDANIGRFGDIVTLASGRLEEIGSGNRTFRFVEGPCEYDCQEERILALWQVQKIRHRDSQRTFRYEMKYSVSPLQLASRTALSASSGDEENFLRNSYQTYIQKDDDYPQNFGRLSYAGEQSFAERRSDNAVERSFRHVSGPSGNDYHQVTPMPESAFARGTFAPPPPPAPQSFPNPDRLNIGEYIKSYNGPKATPKIEVYPNLASRMGYHQPTTFRPPYNLNIVKSDVYQQPQTLAVKFPENFQQQTYNSKLSAPLVTHHFHHHFYMPPSNGENSAEQQIRSPVVTHFKQEATVITPPPSAYYDNFNEHDIHNLKHAPQKVSIPIPVVEEQPELLKQHMVQVTPVPPLRKPHIFQMFPISIGPKIPLFIYPAPVEEEVEEENTKRSNKEPFEQSEQMDSIRYSEPDPLYVSVTDNNSPQLETPPNQNEVQNVQRASPAAQIESYKKHSSPPDSISAQLPPPAKGQDVRVPYVEDEVKNNESKARSKVIKNGKRNDQVQNNSVKAVQIATEKTTSNTIKTQKPTNFEASTRTIVTTPSSNVVTISEATTPFTNPCNTTSQTKVLVSSSNLFVSTSTMGTPLNTVIRNRQQQSRTTTEQPVLKWKPRRKVKYVSRANKEQVAIGSSKQEEIIKNELKDQDTASSITTTKNANEILNEIYEVLTQKSVSKSVSIRVGSNGEEIPVFEDGAVNVMRKEEQK